jgi:hypothetical protein
LTNVCKYVVTTHLHVKMHKLWQTCSRLVDPTNLLQTCSNNLLQDNRWPMGWVLTSNQIKVRTLLCIIDAKACFSCIICTYLLLFWSLIFFISPGAWGSSAWKQHESCTIWGINQLTRESSVMCHVAMLRRFAADFKFNLKNNVYLSLS